MRYLTSFIAYLKRQSEHFANQRFFQGKSTAADRGVFYFFSLVNSIGKALSPKQVKDWCYSRVMGYLLQPLQIYDGDQAIIGTKEEERIFFEYKKKRFLECAMPGDIVLVQGSQRISRIIQTLTRSPYSHAAYYRGNGEVLEVEPEGVLITPIEKYIHLDIRICRPVMMSAEQRGIAEAYMDDMLEKQPKYDIANIEKLLFKYWYSKFRPDVRMYIGGSTRFETYYLCSGLIAHAFHKAKYPILPERRLNYQAKASFFQRRKHLKKTIPIPELENVEDYFEWVAHSPKNYSQIVPADFDHSSFFASIKFLLIDTKHKSKHKTFQWRDS